MLLKILISSLFVFGIISEAIACVHDNTVVLLHGIACSDKSMFTVRRMLEKEDYKVMSIHYASKTKNLNDIVDDLYNNELDEAFWKQAKKVHFVTHSMGGLVARFYLEKYKDKIPKEKLGRVVMLAPPNGGSELADKLCHLWVYQKFYGPAGQELTTEVQKVHIASPYYQIGIIAGNKKWPYFIARFILPGENDGRVTVAKTKLPGMTDHMLVSATHTFIMNKKEVHRQILYFLNYGEFDKFCCR